jgi:hypothetical protein
VWGPVLNVAQGDKLSALHENKVYELVSLSKSLPSKSD